ncbi:hypothetical protein [Treponema phagedenis]|uniref:hypothetical protein n=1 Tax=Treponema phagedenis TaxID=162 RepID=UPI0015A1AA98|nr:hypothetical protein [Treponema phagedenis]NVP24219.1 hypothetical protein [Treponema phagedenis]QLC59733.1 hypothetical protein HW453_13655 [Treponema phagedenis]
MSDRNEFKFLIYSSDAENAFVNVLVKDETIWLTQKSMAELFDCTSDNISLHLKNIYRDGELNEAATIEEFSVVQTEGNRQVERRVSLEEIKCIEAIAKSTAKNKRREDE